MIERMGYRMQRFFYSSHFLSVVYVESYGTERIPKRRGLGCGTALYESFNRSFCPLTTSRELRMVHLHSDYLDSTHTCQSRGKKETMRTASKCC